MRTPTGSATTDDDLRALGEVLWRYRDVLEAIEYHLEVHDLLMTAGRDRWLGRAADHLADACADLAALDHRRTEAVTRAAAALGLPPTATLRELAGRAPEPWAEILTDHAGWLAPAMGRIGDAAARTRSSVEGGLDRVKDLLRSLGRSSGSGYDHSGRPVAASSVGSLLFDDRA